MRGTRAVRPRLRAELVRVTRGIHEQATLHQRDGPEKKVWYESTVEVRSLRQQPATNGFRGVGKKDAGKEGFVVVVHEVGNPALTWRGTSPTHAWQQVIAAVNVRAKTRKKAAVSGPIAVPRPIAAGGGGGDREAAGVRGVRRVHGARRNERRRRLQAISDKRTMNALNV